MLRGLTSYVVGQGSLTFWFLRIFYDMIAISGGCFETDAASNSTNAMITAQQLASLTKIKTKIQNSPHKLQPPQVSDRSHEYEGVLLLSPKLASPRRSLKHPSSLFNDMPEPRIVPAEDNSKKFKRLNSLTTSVKERKSDSPDDSEPDVSLSFPVDGEAMQFIHFFSLSEF